MGQCWLDKGRRVTEVSTITGGIFPLAADAWAGRLVVSKTVSA